MALDVAKERLDAAVTIRDEVNLLLEFEKPSFVDRVRQTVPETVFGWGLLELAKPSRDRDIESEDLDFTVSALQTDAAGEFLDPETVLEIAAGDKLVWLGRPFSVIRPTAIAPTGEPIIYDGLIARIQKSAS